MPSAVAAIVPLRTGCRIRRRWLPGVPADSDDEMPALLGAAGGKAGRGKAKARSSEQARAAVMARWKRAEREKAR